MIVEREGDMFAVGAEALVIPVNCVGVMGAGVAGECRRRFPGADHTYQSYCKHELLAPGGVMLTQRSPAPLRSPETPDIFVAATKDHWAFPSRLDWVIEAYRGIQSVLDFYASSGHPYRSIAIPALGCGLGGLDWDPEVRWYAMCVDRPDCTVYHFPPRGAS